MPKKSIAQNRAIAEGAPIIQDDDLQPPQPPPQPPTSDTYPNNGDGPPPQLQPKPKPSHTFEFWGWGDVENQPPKEWYIAGIIGPGDTAMLYGEPGAGKTFLAIDLIVSAVQGKPWADIFSFDADGPLTICYTAGEGVSGLGDRFKAAAAYRQMSTAEKARLIIVPDVPQLFDAQSPNNVGAFVRAYAESGSPSPDILVIDTQHTASVGADENSAQAASVIIDGINHIKRALGCAVFVLHHSNKMGGAERGSSAYKGALDSQMRCYPKAGNFILEQTKSKHTDRFKPQAYSLVSKDDSAVVFWDGDASLTDGHGAPLQDKVLAVMQSGKAYTAAAVAAAIEDGEPQAARRAKQALNRLVDKGQVIRQAQDDDKAVGSRNPWLFSIAQQGDVMGAADD